MIASAQIAIALLVIAAAGLLVESHRRLRTVDPGFDPQGVVAVSVGLAASEHATADRRAQFYALALDQFRALPGVEVVSAVNHVPLAGDRFGTQVTIEGHALAAPGRSPGAVYRVAMPGYFETMRIRVLEGRDFTARDSENSPGVVIVNASAARYWWPGENALGKRLHRGNAQSANPWLTVVGVVEDVKQQSWKAPAEAEIYIPFLQDAEYRHNPASFLTLTLVLRATNATALPAAIRERIRGIDRNVAIPEIFNMEQVVRDMTWQSRMTMGVVVFFAGLSALLAAVGIYAVMSFVATGRTQEIGIRMALGARRLDVLAMVMRDSLGPIAIGLATGLVAAMVLTRTMSTVLYEVRAFDPIIFGVVVTGLGAIALAASLIPARRAAKLDPLAALRHD